MKTRAVAIAVAVLFAVAGVALGCVDMRDHLTVKPTATPGSVGVKVEPTDERLTINEAKREVEVVVADTARWVGWREKDIAKREQLVAFIEGFASSGLSAVTETAGTWAGPFAPLIALGIGYATKRRGDRTPDQTRKEKEASYRAGAEAGRIAAQSVLGDAANRNTQAG